MVCKLCKNICEKCFQTVHTYAPKRLLCCINKNCSNVTVYHHTCVDKIYNCLPLCTTCRDCLCVHKIENDIECIIDSIKKFKSKINKEKTVSINSEIREIKRWGGNRLILFQISSIAKCNIRIYGKKSL